MQLCIISYVPLTSVCLQRKELDLKPKFPEWDPELHYMVAVLTFLKSIFYMKDFPQDSRNVANPAALDMYG